VYKSFLTNVKQTSHNYVPIKMMSQIQIVDWLTVCTAKVEKKKGKITETRCWNGGSWLYLHLWAEI